MWNWNSRICPGLSAIGLLCGVLAARAGGATGDVYRSDFARQADGPAKLENWSLTGGTYAVEKGWLTVRSGQSNPQAVLPVRHEGDGTYRATVRNARSCHRLALLAKGVYQLEINREHGRMDLLRRVGTGWRTVARGPEYMPYARNTQEFDMRLVWQGTRVCAFLDEKKLIEYDDPLPVPAGGEYGVSSGWGTDLAWRDFRISPQPDLSEWPYEVLPGAAPRDLVEVTRVRGEGDNIYFDGMQPALTFSLRTARAEVTPVRLRLRLIDVRQQEVAREVRSVTLSPRREQEVAVTFQPSRRGCFKVALDAGQTDADMAWVEDLGGFTVVSRRLADSPRNDSSYFGGHMDGINESWHLGVGRKIGIQWARCHNMMQWTWWARVQPDDPGRWVWSDPAQKLVDDARMATLGQFLHPPKWAAGTRPGKSEPFARYVFNTVAHYRGSIRCWEVWNEPHVRVFWDGTPEEYAEMLGIAYREAKRADPDCRVLGGGGLDPRNPAWLGRMLAAPGGKEMDILSIHYLEPDLAPTFLPELRRLLDGQGVKAPIWNTEESVLSTSFFDQLRAQHLEPEARHHFRNACFELVRTYMENIAGGVQRVFYYEQADPWRFREFPKPRLSEQAFSATMWDEGRMLRPIGAAHAAMALAVEGRTYRARVTAGPLRAFIFEGPDGAAAVQYAAFNSFARREGVRLKLPDGALPDDFTVMDFMGNESAPVVDDGRLVLPLAREPVYLVCRGAHGRQRLQDVYANAEVPRP